MGGSNEQNKRWKQVVVEVQVDRWQTKGEYTLVVRGWGGSEMRETQVDILQRGGEYTLGGWLGGGGYHRSDE